MYFKNLRFCFGDVELVSEVRGPVAFDMSHIPGCHFLVVFLCFTWLIPLLTAVHFNQILVH